MNNQERDRIIAASSLLGERGRDGQGCGYVCSRTPLMQAPKEIIDRPPAATTLWSPPPRIHLLHRQLIIRTSNLLRARFMIQPAVGSNKGHVSQVVVAGPAIFNALYAI